MIAYIIRRLFLLVFVLFGVVTLVFFLIHFIPGDPVDIMLGDYALPGDKQELRENLGLDRPILVQYGDYLTGIVQGDLGISIHSKRAVTEEIWERIPASAELMMGAMVVALLIAFPFGILSALKPYGILDSTSMLVSFLGVAMPNFWLGPLLIILFSIQLDWLPINERGGLEHLILPSITLGTAMAAMLSRMIRSSLLEVLGEDYVLNARAKGLPERQVILKHALRNALIPVITVIGLQIGVLLSGAIITEAIFDWPGMGSLLLDGIYNRNYPLVQGCILTIASIYVIVNLITDITYAWVDPRVRLS
ncbi:ABC transporter permease [bacterium]|nr:ABC transporter permease [bacterium]